MKPLEIKTFIRTYFSPLMFIFTTNRYADRLSWESPNPSRNRDAFVEELEKRALNILRRKSPQCSWSLVALHHWYSWQTPLGTLCLINWIPLTESIAQFGHVLKPADAPHFFPLSFVSLSLLTYISFLTANQYAEKFLQWPIFWAFSLKCLMHPRLIWFTCWIFVYRSL